MASERDTIGGTQLNNICSFICVKVRTSFCTLTLVALHNGMIACMEMLKFQYYTVYSILSYAIALNIYGCLSMEPSVLKCVFKLYSYFLGVTNFWSTQQYCEESSTSPTPLAMATHIPVLLCPSHWIIHIILFMILLLYFLSTC